MPTEKQPPMRNDAIAARNAHRNRSRPWPSGCSSSAGAVARRREMPRRTSLVASASECAASARSAVDPDISPLINFAMAMTTFAASAMTIVRQLSFLSILFSAARDRRFIGRSMNASLVQWTVSDVPRAPGEERRRSSSTQIRLRSRRAVRTRPDPPARVRRYRPFLAETIAGSADCGVRRA